jgi:hypothetical protein
VGLAETIHLVGRVVAADGDGRVEGQVLEVEAMRCDIKTKMMKHAKQDEKTIMLDARAADAKPLTCPFPS